MRSGSFAIGLVALVAAACSSSSSAPVGPAACEGGACGEDGPEVSPPNDGGPPVVSEGGGTPVADTGAPTGADAGDDAGPSLMPAFLNDGICLDSPLPAGPDGKSSCTVLLTGVTAGCAQPGLSSATPEEDAALLAYLGIRDDVDGSVLGHPCELAQLAPSASTGSDCASAASGWCEVPRGCASNPGPCTQAICTTAAFDAVANYTSTGWTGYTAAFFDCP